MSQQGLYIVIYSFRSSSSYRHLTTQTCFFTYLKMNTFIYVLRLLSRTTIPSFVPVLHHHLPRKNDIQETMRLSKMFRKRTQRVQLTRPGDGKVSLHYDEKGRSSVSSYHYFSGLRVHEMVNRGNRWEKQIFIKSRPIITVPEYPTSTPTALYTLRVGSHFPTKKNRRLNYRYLDKQ